MGRQVVTLNVGSFNEICIRLERMVMSSGFVPDVVLSIATGGVYVGERLFASRPHVTTKLQRPGTAAKTNFFSGIVKKLPQPVLDAMRVAEASVLDILPARVIDPSRVVLDDLSAYDRILVVDDAVDSGATLNAVLQAVKSAYPEAEVRSAAVTVTTTRPLVTPDFAIFNNYTLIRFPWAMDNRTAD